ncbi:hypothetical protein [Phytohabitans rumicis]|uniref:MobA-like NTP transferase domain-containing protein n=1 Tax=Phytohabitans rumicis TaxID=1076125 RepID=A0A6V8L3Q6_9ACTN|nr:hypothetical protein [Phytohabitans rumicis]GFJ89598.1 hypothetical protein Prum_032400 [Phytohabitans rumicis]
MTRRVVIAVLGEVRWHPPGVDAAAWRAALAEDLVDLLATLNEVEPAIAALPADRALAESVAWPSMPVYDVPDLSAGAIFAVAAKDGYEQAAAVAGDAPDVPGLLVGKLLRPLTTRPLAVAPADPGPGLLGVAARLPAPDWLPAFDLDSGALAEIRAAAPRPADVGSSPPWRRLRTPADLATLDPAVEGWDTTRALLGG